MAKIINKWIIKNIVKILIIYQKSIKHDRYIFKNNLDRTIYYEIHDLITTIEEMDK
ncbi:MAG: hypothetical protein RR290_00760 [Clostridia bacterium]